MNENEMTNALRRLPRASASHRFTSEVMSRVRTRPAGRPALRYAVAFALTCCLVLAGVRVTESRAEAQRLRALRAEHQRIESELRQVKAVAGERRPVVVLENGDARFVVEVADRERTPVSSEVVY